MCINFVGDPTVAFLQFSPESVYRSIDAFWCLMRSKQECGHMEFACSFLGSIHDANLIYSPSGSSSSPFINLNDTKNAMWWFQIYYCRFWITLFSLLHNWPHKTSLINLHRGEGMGLTLHPLTYPPIPPTWGLMSWVRCVESLYHSHLRNDVHRIDYQIIFCHCSSIRIKIM